jgi:hypothetical protein
MDHIAKTLRGPKVLTLRWKLIPGDPPHTMYYIDDSPVGEDDNGFDRILDVIRSHKNIRVILKIQSISSLGGSSLKDSLPFRERFNELREALGENQLIYEFF